MNKFLATIILVYLVVVLGLVRSSINIPGPRSYNDKIAIIGAGPSGVHMAYLLKQKGFRNIHILEKTSRIGGKSQTLYYRGAPQELGTVYISPDYEENIVKLVNKYIPGDLVNLPSASIWLGNKEPITYQQYIIQFGREFLRTDDKIIILKTFVRTLRRYITLHRNLFGEYEGELFPEPSQQTMKLIGGTFKEFLERNNMLILTPIFEASTTVQGYGNIHSTAALYGLLWNTPKFMNGFLERLKGSQNSTGNYMLKSGFQNLWETMAKKERLHVKFNVDIVRVYRNYKNGCQSVWLCMREGGSPFAWKNYDFLIWSPEMKRSLRYWMNYVPKEKKLFNAARPTYFTASIVNSKNEIRGQTPIDYWIDNMHEDYPHSVWAQRDSYSSIRQYGGPKYQNSKLPSGNDNRSARTCVVYQMGSFEPTLFSVQNKLLSHLKKINGTNIEILKTKIWRYFPRYSPRDMTKGYLWRILELQGKYSMWYIGSSVCFESVKSVIEYNELLVRNMQQPLERTL